jgi:predicted RNase H-like nuclease (RuvC/YqgF family)
VRKAEESLHKREAEVAALKAQVMRLEEALRGGMEGPALSGEGAAAGKGAVDEMAMLRTGAAALEGEVMRLTHEIREVRGERDALQRETSDLRAAAEKDGSGSAHDLKNSLVGDVELQHAVDTAERALRAEYMAEMRNLRLAAPDPKPQTPNPKPPTPNPKSQTLNPKP